MIPIATLKTGGGIRVLVELYNRINSDDVLNSRYSCELIAPIDSEMPQFTVNPKFLVRIGYQKAGGRILAFIRSIGPLISKLRKSDIVIFSCVQLTFTCFLAKLLNPKATFINYVQHDNTLLLRDTRLLGTGIAFQIFRLINWLSLQPPFVLMTNSKWTADRVVKKRITKKDYFLLNPGFNRNVFKKREHKNADSPEEFQLMTIARPHTIKGFDDLLAALDIIKKRGGKFRLLAVTHDKMTTTGSHYFDIDFLKPRDDNELAALYHHADIFISSSWWEGYGLPPLEAMACGLPVITTNSGGVLEFCQDRKNCLLCERRNPNKLAEKILYLMNEHKLRKKLEKDGRDTIEHLSDDNVAKRFIGILDKHLGTS